MIYLLTALIAIIAVSDASVFMGRGYRQNGVSYVNIFGKVINAEESSVQKVYKDNYCYLCSVKPAKSGRLPSFSCEGPSPVSTDGKTKYISPC